VPVYKRRFTGQVVAVKFIMKQKTPTALSPCIILERFPPPTPRPVSCSERQPPAQVYKGRRRFTGQVVAMKFIMKHGKSEKDIKALRQEIEILRTLRHENIIRMLDDFETPTDFCVVTEFAQGGTPPPPPHTHPPPPART